MKKNILQIITTGLCVVLLIVVIVQGKKMDELSQNVESEIDTVQYDLQREIRQVSNIVESKLEELDSVVLKSELKTVGIDKDAKKLLTEATVTLKEWQKDTEVTLYVTQGDEKSQIAMTSDGNGTFSAIVEFPCEVDTKNVIELEILVSGGYMVKKESLGAWGDVFGLLPLQSSGSSWMRPPYENGIMSGRFEISVSGQNGATTEVYNPEFWIYKNGELAQQIEAVEETSHFADEKSYTADQNDIPWSIECDLGDDIVIRFRCEDEYGLGYDFFFANWFALPDFEENSQSASASIGTNKSLVLYWPE